MAAYISFQPTDFFNALILTGTGATRAVTGVGFQPDWVWAKTRSVGYDNSMCDAVRGTTKTLMSNATTAEQTYVQALTAFDSDGFTMGTDGNWNVSAEKLVYWNWKAGTTTGLDFSAGDITPSAYSINTTSGIGIYKFAGTNAVATIAHGLGATPSLIIVKETSKTSGWVVYHESMDNTSAMYLNTTAAEDTHANYWNDTSPTSTLFTMSTYVNTTATGVVAYVFAEKKGYSKFGQYVGNYDVNGPFTYTGFRPAFIMVKNLTTAANWTIRDNARDTFNPTYNYVYPNLDNAGTNIGPPATSGSYPVDFLSNGFRIRNTDDKLNTGSDTYIYAAFAEFPLVSSNDIPGVAR